MGRQAGTAALAHQHPLMALCPQDAKPLEVYSVDFMVDNAQLGFLGKPQPGLGTWGGLGGGTGH